MFNSGCPLVQSLSMLKTQTENQQLAEAAGSLARQLESGHYLSQALARHPWLFSQVQARLVQLGETSGQLGAMLLHIADHEEQGVELRLKLRSALLMPLMVCAFSLLMTVLVPPLLFTGLFEILQDTGAELPLPTRLLIMFNSALRSPWSLLLLAGLVAGAAWAVRRVQGDPARQARCWKAALRLPVVGGCLQLQLLTRWTQSMHTMLRSGVPILQALKLAGDCCGSAYVEELSREVVTRVQEGQTLAESLAFTEFFPSGLRQSVSAGEEAGQLTAMCKSMMELYGVELDHSLSVMARALEPIVLGVVGSIVCFVVLATLMPMLKLVESL